MIRGLVKGSKVSRTLQGIRVGLAVFCAGLVAACGSQRAVATSPAPPTVTVPLSTSLVTAQGTWAIAVMGGSAASDNNFWQLFVRPTGASRWSLVTPPGVADNGGLVAAGGGTSLTVGFRPSQDLAFSPLATSTDDGQNWTPGLLSAGLAGTPGAIAVASSGRTLALLQDGTIQAAPTASAAAAGQWTQLTTLKALAASAPGRSCGLTSVHAVSFGPGMSPMAAGSCERPGVAGVFTYASGRWRSAGLALPATFGGDQVQVLGLTADSGGDVALLLAGNSLLAAWWTGRAGRYPIRFRREPCARRGSVPAGARGRCLAAAGRRPSADQAARGRRYRPRRRARRRSRRRAQRWAARRVGRRVGRRPRAPTRRWPSRDPGSPSGGSPSRPGRRSS